MFVVFPYRDENETVRAPVVTLALIATNVLIWFVVQGHGSAYSLAESVCDLGLIPGELTLRAIPGTGSPMGSGLACLVDEGRAPMHVLTSMFLHGSWDHLISNMWFLWLFGNNVDDSMGRMRFIWFYLLSGVAAAAAQVLSDPSSIYPMIGASGAISGVMAAYMLLYGNVRVFTFVWIVVFITSIALPAWLMIGAWFLLQVFYGLHALGSQEGGVAFSAHVGGFVAGLLMIKLFARPDYIRMHRAHQWRPRRQGFRRSEWD